MNKRIIIAIFIFSLLNLFPCFGNNYSVELRTAAFFPSSGLFRGIYGKVGTCYQAEGSAKWKNCWDLWSNIDWFTKHGESLGFRQPTRINILNFSLGIKYVYPFSRKCNAYIGLGPNLSVLWLKNNFLGHREKVSKRALGGIVKLGIQYFITDCYFLDLFVDYLYQPMHFKNHVNVGGFKTGIGLGTQF